MIIAALLFVLAATPPKNVQVLTETTDLIPVMTVMANSLGVTCAHCHEADWASDAKPAKETARRMIAMTRAINQTHFADKTVVGCYTCHGGRIAPSAVPLLADAGWNKQPTAVVQPVLPAAEEVFAAYLKTWGTNEIRNRRSIGVAIARSGRGDPRSAPFELFQELPKTNELRVDLPYPPEGDREFLHQFFNAKRIRERYSAIVTKGVDEVRGRTAWVVEATPADGSLPERLWFDAASGVLLRRHRERPTIVGILPEEYDFDDYRRIDGALVPFLLQWSRGDYQVTHRIASMQQNVTK